jgi:RNA polymerase sigma-70 factor, ECF subfamily
MTAIGWADGDLVAVFGASTVARYERAMFVPRKTAPEPAAPSETAHADRTESGPAPVSHARREAFDDAGACAAMLRYAQGDNSAFADVYAQLAPRLHGFCVRLCAGGAEADDLLQETLLKLHRSRTAYRPDAHPLHWAFAIARCAYIDRLRRRKARPEVLGDGPSALAANRAGSEPESELRAAQLRELVQSVLSSQPEAARTSYILVRLEGVSVADAAAILSASSDAIKQRVHRVAQALREQLQRRGLDVNP